MWRPLSLLGAVRSDVIGDIVVILPGKGFIARNTLSSLNGIFEAMVHSKFILISVTQGIIRTQVSASLRSVAT